MRPIIFVFAFCLVLSTSVSALAKGAAGGGHSGHGGHGGAHGGHGGGHGAHGGAHVAHIYHGRSAYSTLYIAPATNAGDNDEFEPLRSLIMNGYVAYGADTLQGIIVCADNIISLKPGPQDSTYMFSMADTNLHFVCLEDNGEQLNLVRLKDKKLYRQLHAGKLSVYDTYFSFDLKSKQFFNVTSRVVYDGKEENLGAFPTINIKKKLVGIVNDAYGYSLNDENYNKDQLLAYLQKLD